MSTQQPEPIEKAIEDWKTHLDTAQAGAEHLTRWVAGIGAAMIGLTTLTAWWQGVVQAGSFSVDIPAKFMWLVVLFGSNALIFWWVSRRNFNWREYYEKSQVDFWTQQISFIPEWSSHEASIANDGTVRVSVRIINRSGQTWYIDTIDRLRSALAVGQVRCDIERGVVQSLTIRPWGEWTQQFIARIPPSSNQYETIDLSSLSVFIRKGAGSAESVVVPARSIHVVVAP